MSRVRIAARGSEQPVSYERSSDDPGWRPAFRAGLTVGLLSFVFPQRRLASLDGLSGLRAIFVSFVIALMLIGLVVLIMDLGGGGLSAFPVGGGVGGFGVLMLTTGRFVRRPLDSSSLEALADSYRKRFFLRVAFAESSALAGFVGFILTGGVEWIYGVGLAVALVGFARLAPTAHRLSQDQAEINRSGSALDLIVALKTMPAGGSAPAS